MIRKLVLIVVVIAILFMSSAFAEDIKGVVVRVLDGDTYYMRTDGGDEIKVRQLAIDAPETTQPYGTISAEFNTYLLLGRNVIVHTTKKDRYGRTLGSTSVLIGEEWFEAEALMIRNGMAWHYQKYDNKKYLDAIEDSARVNRRGLWIEDNPTPPWTYRQERKNKK